MKKTDVQLLAEAYGSIYESVGITSEELAKAMLDKSRSSTAIVILGKIKELMNNPSVYNNWSNGGLFDVERVKRDPDTGKNVPRWLPILLQRLGIVDDAYKTAPYKSPLHGMSERVGGVAHMPSNKEELENIIDNAISILSKNAPAKVPAPVVKKERHPDDINNPYAGGHYGVSRGWTAD